MCTFTVWSAIRKLNAASGSIDASGIGGCLRVSSASGDTRVADVKGEVEGQRGFRIDPDSAPQRSRGCVDGERKRLKWWAQITM